MRAKELGVDKVESVVATGPAPNAERIKKHIALAYTRALEHENGAVADYIPVLAKADPEHFGLCVVGAHGGMVEMGDSRVRFSIQSISKAFVYALLHDAVGREKVLEALGVNNTGLAFNSVMAIELNDGHPQNPMVNAGAMAATALMPGDPMQKWDAVRTGLSKFAGRELEVDDDVYESEMSTNYRNRAIARLLQSYGHIECDPADAIEVYTRQCSLNVDAHDLAVMAATLADGGVNPLTGERVVSAAACRDTLAVLTANGLYERSGEWLFEIGLPGKSGVAGGLVTAAPGKGGIGSYSPRLDSAGNSVRGQVAAAYLARTLGMDMFASDSHFTAS
ncbi:glutaminase A (plasmid) [Coraliomargarita sp. W4R53]